jgi:uncharacterized protein YdcH (DUF465 family)
MDAKCFNCNNKADFNIEKNKITCKKCNIEIGYDEYIENMKEKALSLADDLQYSWDKQG